MCFPTVHDCCVGVYCRPRRRYCLHAVSYVASSNIQHLNCCKQNEKYNFKRRLCLLVRTEYTVKMSTVTPVRSDFVVMFVYDFTCVTIKIVNFKKKKIVNTVRVQFVTGDTVYTHVTVGVVNRCDKFSLCRMSEETERSSAYRKIQENKKLNNLK